MTPGMAPPRRAAAAWPNSWKPADSTVTATTSSSSPGLSNASCAAAARPLLQQDPPAHDQERQQHHRHQHGVEQPGERRRDPAGPLGVADGVLEPQRQQRVGLLDLRLAAVGLGQQAQRAQLVVDERAHVVRRDGAAEAAPSPARPPRRTTAGRRSRPAPGRAVSSAGRSGRPRDGPATAAPGSRSRPSPRSARRRPRVRVRRNATTRVRRRVPSTSLRGPTSGRAALTARCRTPGRRSRWPSQ